MAREPTSPQVESQSAATQATRPGNGPDQPQASGATAKTAPRAAPKPAAKEAGKTDPVDRKLIRRRKVVWFGVFGFIGVCAAATMRFFFPRALFEPKTRFRIGYPSDYGFGVNTKWQAAQRIWVVRDSGSLYVIEAKCTHLGCTPDWKETENKFKCPCHGSGFDTEGVNFEGPAPRPLDRLHVELDAEGQIVVDKSKTYGGSTLAAATDAWKLDGAFLQV